ncbi:FecR family protein [Brevundimonas nasdae]|uniref:FecR domain-containing protein n=1 Tax=Brevundimonas nasdae TaxID=172043 RepID=A0ABX8TN78_9CAUL|nr:FecR domain-containing protein [Brevundimonas nasdae]QYC10694.1 FecR domain-containing protein [Brevundimonas nasdae]QYC13481.1 FecR domain-containing protein [Brevundimonas nasdae]
MTERGREIGQQDADARMIEDGLAEEARAWVTLLQSGEATQADARALAGWRMTSLEHERAFVLAARAHQITREAIRSLKGERAPRVERTVGRAPVNRRVLIGGGAALAAGLATIAVLRPDTFTSGRMEEIQTVKGERRTVDMGHGVSVELNTLSRVALRDDLGQGGFELLRGEALVSIASSANPVQIMAGAARIIAGGARLGLRNLSGDLSAVCLEGQARVLLKGREALLSAGQKVVWSAGELGAVTQLAQAAGSEWWRGVLVFNNARLGDVIGELNRYREGRIVVANPAIADRRISGAFYINRLDQVVEQLRLAYGVKIVRMPGNILIVS